MDIKSEVERRKTFAIISHPDAGKTTLTEKLLLFGGAIQTAGAVKSNKIKKTATSDFMEIEKQRGISVATSVMGFEYKNYKINLLDTPGHKDFAEDTYRTLTAVDSVVLVIDSMNGVEEQTENLIKVCRMRKTPVIVFINKMDRPGRDTFTLLDEIEEKLGIKVVPLTWPINNGDRFKGVYNIHKNNINIFKANKTKISDTYININNLDDKLLDETIGNEDANLLREEVELVSGVYENLNINDYRNADVAPVFFGSALNSFGVEELLNTFIEIAPIPQKTLSNVREINPFDEKLSGFVFKIHANLDPKHRDRIAFFKICSGRFERNKFYYHTKHKKNLRFSNPTSFMAQEKELIDEAFAGDVIGLYDAGNFKIGDSLTEGEEIFFKGIPSFSPEIFKEIINKNPLKSKQLIKGLDQLAEEGVAQMFTQQPGNKKIIGVVGPLQFDVIQYRLLHEYGAECDFEHKNFRKACWITSNNKVQMEEFLRRKYANIVTDNDGVNVFLADSEFILRQAKIDYPELIFHENNDFKVL